MTPSAAIAADEPVLPGPLLIVEDEPLMQIRLRTVLTALGYTQDALFGAASVAEARQRLADQPFALVLVDVGLPDGNGVELIRQLHLRDPALPVLVISAWSTEQIILGALQAGASGYLLKERDDVEISLSIRSALRGGAPIDPFVARRILALGWPAAPAGQHSGLPELAADAPHLSARETEILTMVSKGLTNREISSVLTLSRLTVECHIRNIYKKLAVRSRTEAIFEARAHGLLR